MNKNLILMALAALSVSCSNEEIVEQKAQMPIGFRANTANVVMKTSTLVDGSSLKNNPFEVYAFNAKDNKLFMGRTLKKDGEMGFSTGVEISYQGSEWKYTKPEEQAYWPVDALDFYAFQPLSDPAAGYTVEVVSNNKQQVSYAVPTNQKFEKDILYAVAKNVTKDSNGGKVKLNFKHALSLVSFKAKTALESMTVDIEDWKIHVISPSGTMTLPADAQTAPVWQVGKKAQIDNEHEATKNMDRPIDNIGNAEAVSLGSKLYLPQTLKPWDTKISINEVNVMAGENSKTPEEEKQSYLSILCKIKQNGNLLWGEENKYVRLFVPFGDTWEPGKKYIYTLIFGGGYNDQGQPILKPLVIEADVENMQDAEKEVETTVGTGTKE